MRSPRTALLAQFAIATLVLGLVAPSALALERPGKIATFPLPTGVAPGAITAGPDGNLWFTEGPIGNGLGRMTSNGELAQFPLSPAARGGIVSGPDGNLWFTATTYANDASGEGSISRITPSGGLTEYPIHGPKERSGSEGIAVGPEGNLWFTEPRAAQIGRITPTGQIAQFPIPSDSEGSQRESFPTVIALGGDRNLWFADQGRYTIDRVSPSGQFAEFRLPNQGEVVTGITAGADGNVWFSAIGAITLSRPLNAELGRITPSGKITLFPLRCKECGVGAITAGPDGNLWFTDESDSPAIGRITPSGVITEFPLPPATAGAGTRLRGITTGTDGNLWFTSQTWTTEVRDPTLVRAAIGAIAPGVLAIAIETRRVSVRRGHTALRLECVGGLRISSACHGVLRIFTRDRRYLLARRHYNVATGKSARVPLHLSRRATVLLTRHRPLIVFADSAVSRGRGASREIALRLRPHRGRD